jgi:hypothetical protein
MPLLENDRDSRLVGARFFDWYPATEMKSFVFRHESDQWWKATSQPSRLTNPKKLHGLLPLLIGP